MTNRNEENVHQQMATELVMIIHLSMDWDTWGSKRLKYWEIFQNAVSSAAYTNKLSRWLANICNRMNIGTPGRSDNDRQNIAGIINSGMDKPILRLLREETQTLILEVRVAQQEKKEASKLEKENGRNADLFA